MKDLLTWKFGIIVSCSLTVGAILFWDRFKNNSIKKSIKKREDKDENDIDNLTNRTEKKRLVTSTEIEQLPCPRWIKAGKIKELFYYPLKSGRGKEIFECKFTEYGIAVIDDKCITLRDRMFLVYNEENGKFITGRNYPTLLLVSLCAVDKFKVKLEAIGMPPLIFELPQNSDSVDCSMWWGEPLKCTDCGNAPAEWISKFLTGTDSGLRIGMAISDNRNILKGPWEKFTKVYDTLTNDDVGLFADLASYMLMTESSLEELNKKLDNKISSLQFRPNIVVSGTDAFAEDDWEWIKIGESVILRNVKPCPRCTMTRVNPETGEADKQEPLKTLKTFREQTDPQRVLVDGKAPVLGIYCGLYAMGDVKVGDDVFLHVPKSARTTKL
ncbi:mitochondrial amidoxime-reducing component 1-like [Microplitis mediator]|uniref:mitochondrial amidoxime-reducing component 1-like n=1 Tax=Microplitis mediator TaxID=375433 RepID=UPI0025537769|nr:mitochondrial amidoxime-reducing component 1-like [Microplitis mediator]